MDCSYFRERINRYIDGELGYLEVAELQSHLSHCADCAVELTQLGHVRGSLAAWGRLELGAPSGFAERVMNAVEREPAADSSWPLGNLVIQALEKIDGVLGRMPLPGGRTVSVRNALGCGLAAAVVFELERRHMRRSRELKPS
jgi:anti-sigma factor RsiW